ncbi:FAD/NAD(P)-binding protein [Paraburkholderia aromaticivorans]|uniref:Ni/Fe hydrogenase subunit gamma n=1 Tax=Paraburkholderia aromaticivorans TaxID=2026199 RepID=A0A248VL12_9BURK|nr:FAD/NAD(P)-binding protein [Paraburkholderia aromaticivorans]ASV99099.1 Ni/Fe hydrogenase subunit gamma [Paraburkholderia aromaticivorans]
MVAADAPNPFVPEIYRVGRVRRELSDTATLECVPPAGSCPAAEAGQFNMLYVFGVGEVPVSMSGSPADQRVFVHTVRNVGAVSAALTRLRTGATIGLRGPFGTGWPIALAEGADIVIVAGGLGLAPLRPAIYQLLARRRSYGRVVILVGSRSPKDLLYRRELEQWRNRPDVQVDITVDHADTGWHGHVGVVPALIARAGFDPRETVALVCGPEVMMRFTANALLDAGVSPERIYLSMERNMKCAIGLCGHCQFGPAFLCKDGPVMRFDTMAGIFAIREI